LFFLQENELRKVLIPFVGVECIEFLFFKILQPWLKNKRKNRITLDEEWLEPVVVIIPCANLDPLMPKLNRK
jgi:hypothetical protein